MKKTGLFLLGLTTGAAAAAYFAYRKMDDEKTKELVDKTVKTANDLKDRALDYAFYALDSVDDVKESLQYKTSDATSKIKDAAGKVNDNVVNKAQYYYDEGSTQFHKAADSLRNQVRKANDSEDDVVIEPDFLKHSDEEK
ncbi:YtxH domain-containing protein [Apilactobacillus apinorum]|uniref:YtxH domain-containing protein n=1 Tax=Apilactobacillus apinorum TaxID=1218495 RepID=A0ABP9ZGY4_9LACO|nr:YtxH domain-containing protein [Apilactobacillus apinorum]KOY69150.1 hypothetical protein RZ74_05060 [Apilactobacillus apinorum]CAI2653766.1 Hypothetical protein AAPFHON13_05350 [Apilactobacillus apinorum]